MGWSRKSVDGVFRQESLSQVRMPANLIKVFYTFYICLMKKMLLSSKQNFDLINDDSDKENYRVDIKIMQLVIRELVESGNYTLEGIAHSCRLPLDVILDAASGNMRSLSITLWSRIVDLYVEARPEIFRVLVDWLSDTVQRPVIPAGVK